MRQLLCSFIYSNFVLVIFVQGYRGIAGLVEIMENEFGPGKSMKSKCNVLESPALLPFS